MNTTITFSGPMYRCIPSSSTSPLDSQYSSSTGGRWNAAGTYEVLYTFLSPDTARTWVTGQYENSGLSINDVQPTKLPDLMILSGTYSNVANLTADEGLTEMGLPVTYPVAYVDMTAYSVTQPIGATLHSAGHSSILTRSAAVTDWDGSVEDGTELVIFVDIAPKPGIVDRISYKDWL